MVSFVVTQVRVIFNLMSIQRLRLVESIQEMHWSCVQIFSYFMFLFMKRKGSITYQRNISVIVVITYYNITFFQRQIWWNSKSLIYQKSRSIVKCREMCEFVQILWQISIVLSFHAWERKLYLSLLEHFMHS